MATEVLKVGQLGTNCYLFYDTQSREAFIIDPGDDVEYIVNKISDLGLNPGGFWLRTVITITFWLLQLSN